MESHVPRACRYRRATFGIGRWIFGGKLGTRLVDLQFTQGDPVELIRRTAGATPQG